MAGGIFGRLRALLGSATPIEPPSTRELFVEEDFYGEIEVLPAAMAGWCREELGKIAAFADRHQAPGGAGWTDIYIRPPAPMSLADLRMPLASTLEALGGRLAPFDRVTTGSFYSPEPMAGARAFGPSPRAAVIVAADADGAIVRSMMLVLDDDGADAAAVMAALRASSSVDGLIVVDWARGVLARLP